MPQTELAWVAQVVERVLGKDEVTGSIPVPGSRGRGRGLCLQPAGINSGLYLEPARSWIEQGGGNSTVESRSSKAMVAGSNPVPRSKDFDQRFRSDGEGKI